MICHDPYSYQKITQNLASKGKREYITFENFLFL